MYFSRSIVAAALVGFGAATTHAGEGLASAVSESMPGAMVEAAPTGALPAQAPAATGASGAAPGAGVKVHMVQVGMTGLTFEPSNIVAAAGDLVQFQFHPKNHSVVQSTFDQPCVPIQNVMANKTDAFFSGFMPTAANSTAKPLVYTIRVMDTKPVWFYCSQGMHCQGGMVGAINAAAAGNRTIDAFKSLAAVAVANLSPGQAPGAASPQVPGAAAPSGGAGTTGTTGGATPSSALNPAEQTTNAAPGHLSGQSLLGLGMGGLAAFFLL